jgi:DNA-directed RNA polymerase specialized sigma24 family protein
VTQAFDRLGEEDRLVIAARYLLGMSRKDAASALSIAAGLIDEHLSGALRRLRDRIGAA